MDDLRQRRGLAFIQVKASDLEKIVYLWKESEPAQQHIVERPWIFSGYLHYNHHQQGSAHEVSCTYEQMLTYSIFHRWLCLLICLSLGCLPQACLISSSSSRTQSGSGSFRIADTAIRSRQAHTTIMLKLSTRLHSDFASEEQLGGML